MIFSAYLGTFARCPKNSWKRDGSRGSTSCWAVTAPTRGPWRPSSSWPLSGELWWDGDKHVMRGRKNCSHQGRQASNSSSVKKMQGPPWIGRVRCLTYSLRGLYLRALIYECAVSIWWSINDINPDIHVHAYLSSWPLSGAVSDMQQKQDSVRWGGGHASSIILLGW